MTLAAGPPPGVAGVEAVLGATGAFGFPGGAKVGPQRSLPTDQGQYHASLKPSVACCVRPRGSTSFDGIVRSGISHALEEPWKQIEDLEPGPAPERRDLTSRKTSVVETRESSSLTVAC